MANLSQMKHERMLAFLNTIREEHKEDDDVLIALGEIENELTSKKYGLVWEQHEEAADIQMRDNIPATGLKRIKDACDRAGCRVEFETPDDGFVVVFYRHGIQKLSGIAQRTAQKEEKTAQKTAQKEERINALLEYCKEPRNRDEMMEFLGMKHRTTFRSDYLNPLLNEGKIAMTMPDKPRSKNQKFYSV